MDAIGNNIQPVVIKSYPAAQAKPAAPAAVPAPKPVADSPLPVEAQVQSVEQQRYEAVKKASQDAPNVYPLGDRTFTIFKDSSGQYVTRYFSQRTGQVSYVPEPETLKQSSAYIAPALNIKA